MADVTPAAVRDRRPRAQLLIVGAILLGVIFVGIALVINSAIFAENVATRQNDVGSDIQTFRSVAAAGVGDAIRSTNREGAGDPFTQLRDGSYHPRVEALSGQLANRRSLEGASVDIVPVDSRPGTQIVDNDTSTDLLPRGGAPTNWTMAPTSHIRSFELTVEPDSGSDLGTALTGGSGDAFVVTLSPTAGSAPAHEVAIYADGGTRVAVSEVGSSTVRECEADAAAVTVSLTGRPRVDGAYCRALDPVADAPGTYNVTVTNGDRATGTYRLTVDRPDGPTTPAAVLDEQVDRANYGLACSSSRTYHDTTGEAPYSVPAIYAGTVELYYQGQQSESRTTTRVTPAQAGDGLTTPLVASLAVTDGSNASGNGDAAFDVDWTVEDPDGDLDSVTVEARNRDDDTITSNTTDLSGAGGNASGSASFTDAGDDGDEYALTVTVTDGTDSRSRTVHHLADGDETGCPA